MCAQVKKAACKTSKNIIYAGDRTIPATYQEWKDQLLCIDYNWQLKKVENSIMVSCLQRVQGCNFAKSTYLTH